MRYGHSAGDWQLQLVVKPERPRLALDRVADLHHLALVSASSLSVAAADDLLDTGGPASVVVVGLVDPSAQRSFSQIVVDVDDDAATAFTGASPLRVTQMIVLFKQQRMRPLNVVSLWQDSVALKGCVYFAEKLRRKSAFCFNYYRAIKVG